MFYISKNRWSSFGIEHVSELYLDHLKAYKGIRKKCIVLDLDNTLWGGIIGQDGKESILLSNDGIGKSYYDFQNALLKLYRRGIILAVCSKNNVTDALEFMKEYPYMILRPEYFTAIKINWNNKDINIREIAQELNIGLDSLVFLDDSQFERELVATQLPEVSVPALPDDPSFYTEFLSELNYFDFHTLSEEDLKRNKSYKDNLLRKKTEISYSNIEDYYRSLEMQVIIKSIDEFSLPRIVQLINKTNQFNLTSRRYTEAEIRNFAKDVRYRIMHISLDDRFGENGIIGVVITIQKDTTVFIDTFLLSCRVIGRTVETAILSHLARKAKVMNNSFLVGEYNATAKNESCKEFYRMHKFIEKENNLWEFNLKEYEINCPDWIKLIGE
jgi:FkbH-like protein